MNDAEFMELLNLYLDHEIGPDKAALLEAEVARDPARRQVYRQYCRMQKACVVLAGQFVGEAPATAEILSGRPARRGHPALWATGLAAAAACAALAIFPLVRPAAPAPSVPADLGLALSAPAAPAARPARSDFQPVFVARAVAASAPAASPALFPAGAPNGQFAWIQQVQMAPIGSLSATPLFLAAKPALDLDNRPESERSPEAASEQKAAFSFQR
jgi:hypothetical protein